MEDHSEPVATSELSKKINVISKEAVHQICSGQVVLDLAVAIKELVENSLDSGATYVDIKLVDYGQTCITVSDNGSGVLETDFEGLGLKHHTSKLRDFSDIFEISTFGFRGEALSSLCSLSDLSITTRHSSVSHGFKLHFDKNGKLVKQERCAREVGTTVSVRNIFKSLPVRAKEFQRNIKKEFTKALQVLYGYCLVSRGIKITCSNSKDGKPGNTVVSTTGADGVLENASTVFGKKSLSGIDTVDLVEPDETVLQDFNLSDNNSMTFTWEFYTSSCEHRMGCASPNRQFFYINGRPCVLTKISKLINHIYHKYNNKQYPFVYLNLKLPQDTADVNVTPDKRTVFLTQEKIILATVKMSLQVKWNKMQGNYTSLSLHEIQSSLKRSLPSPINNPPNKKKMVSSSVENSEEDPVDAMKIQVVTAERGQSDVKMEKLRDIDMKIDMNSVKSAVEMKRIRRNKRRDDFEIKYRAEMDSKSSDAERELQKGLTTESFEKMRIIGQFNLGFIITQLEGDLFIIDQHATDEKYRFEKLSRETRLKTQKLIAPKPLNFSSLNETIIAENQEFFDANGFTMVINPEALPGQRVHLTGMPVSGNWQFGEEDLEELIFLIREGGTEGMKDQDIVRPSRVRSMLASRACRGAVMIGKALNSSEMRRLVCQMGMIHNPWNCPHGRPTIRHLLSLKLLRKS
ncbi:mismatch repair endonuclease PMS2 [Fopius arisanus]|uniref:Mismatch repair endonuclease PMS2 n=1 Tax=Fopius arisanus TaxID=64838 RepID=A0A0C9R9H1_9HYME|nr:PREDICTED: mismatch repair endonuclease PMS2 [Fopius arisanus]XP_011311448.1 PREDICTED: mismatch repair endonuclease PMS2 [Fopius arisanus]XP_011311449.1 PREDICTED: mismatch repair endonuclease PMS2 [Fopius arisanus]